MTATAEFQAAHQDVIHWLYRNEHRSGFARNVGRYIAEHGKATPAQVWRIRRMIGLEREQRERASRPDAPRSGRLTGADIKAMIRNHEP